MNEYEKLRMRQNPMLQQRAQVGGRSMPAWFASNLVTQSRIGAPSPPPPPLPAEPPPVESDYEEIDHLPKNQMKKNSSRRSCSLCGNPNPAVSCEMCNDQIFCGSCNDMYHRHPKRQHHSRKILEPIVDNRPPLPPKTPVPPEMALPPLPPSHPPGQYPSSGVGSVTTPQPPPRRKGRFGMRSTAGSPTTGIKSFFDPVGTLKKFMGGMAHRPLPPPPNPAPPLPPKPAELGRSMTPTFRGPMMGDRRLNSPQPGAYPQDERRAGMPMSVMEMQNSRMHSMSVANLSGHMGSRSRDSGYPDWEEDDETDFFSRNRAQSVSGGVLGRFPSTSQDASHFATLHRPGRNQRQQLPQSTTSLSSPQQNPASRDNPPERPPPPLPPRQFPSQTQLSFQSSQSAFDLDRMAAVAQQQNAAAFGMPPWNYPMPMQGYPYDFQQAMMMGFPGSGTMHRTPSTQSMGPSMNPASGPPNQQQQQFFGWGPMGFGPPMSQMEMEMMTRRGSEQFMNLLPPQQSQRGVPLSNPVTPQGSFRKKTSRHMSVEPEFTRRLDNRSGLDFSQNRRSGTPSSFVRVQPASSSVASSPAPSIPSAFASAKPIKPPAKPPSNSDQSPDDSYFSAEKQQLTESSESTPELTEDPEGPWECEHCTFINPKSTRVCTICCKTPSAGFKPMKGKRNVVGTKGRWGKRPAAASVDQVPSPTKSGSSSSSRRRDSSKESASSATTGTDEVVPVLKSKLSISRDQKQQQTKIDLVSKVEKERVKKSAMKPGSSGTLKAGMVPPEVKAAIFKASAPKKKATKAKVIAPVVQVETDEDDEEELIAEPEADEKEEEDVNYGQGSSEKDEDDEEEEEDEDEEEDDDDEREQKSDDENADDEENGVVNVKITAGSSKMGRAGHISRGKVATVVAPSKKAVTSTTAGVKAKAVRGRSSTSQTRRLVDSNEDVYGSVPIQTLAISPKIDIKRPSKSKVSTAVGTSPPKQNEISLKSTKKSSGINTSPPPSGEYDEDVQKDEKADVKIAGENKASPETEEKKPVEVENNSRNSPEMSTITVSVTSSSVKPKKTKKTRKMSVSTGTQAESEKKEESINKKESGSSSPFQAGKDVKEEIAAVLQEAEKTDEQVKANFDLDATKSNSSGKDKSSVGVGTSPPPQSISTQTNEDAPIQSSVAAASEITLPISSGMGTTKSSSKTSLKSDNEYYDAPRHIEMSEKAMRYARKAKNREQHYQKLKRSLSTQLTYPGEPWMDSAEGRNLYRSSSRQSLASDTRSLPMSGPPSRDSSPPPMGRYSGMESRGGGGSRGGWYEEFRRYPPSAWDSRYGMPPDSFFASIDDLMSRRRKESMRSQEFELTRMLKDAEEYNFSPEDVQVGIRMCGDKNPIKWLQENWLSMIETVQTLSTKYGYEKGIENNDVGTISIAEAKESIRANRGNVWAAVTECVDQRRRKFHELESRGTFLREDILTTLTANNGNLEAAYVELSKAQLKPFLMRIWGQPGTTDTDDTESVAPSSSDETSKSKKQVSSIAKQSKSSPTQATVQPSIERSSSLPGPPETKTKKTRKTSLATGKLTKTSSATATVKEAKEEQKPKLEELVFSAEKVTQEIEKAIQELKRKGAEVAEPEAENNENETDEHVTKAEEREQQADIQDESRESIQADGLQIKSESESEHSSVAAQHLKSDDGEDESFADAVSGSVSIANSPPPIPLSPQNEIEDENEINEPLLTEINNNTINITLNDNNEEILDEEEEFDDDVLEIEIDDTEANISEFIQNYEILPAEQAVTPLSGEEQEVEDDDHHSEEDEREIEDNEVEPTEEDDDDGASASENDKAVTKVEIEKLMTALTSTFSEMEQFAYKMKENIATEIQQQLAAASGKSNKGSSHDHSEDGSYEPIALPPGIEENVNKKVAKYQKLAAKKKQKVGRHKSPETRAFQLGDIREKEPSVSPLPSTSEDKIKKKKRANQKDDGKASGDSASEQQEAEDEEEIERTTIAQSQLSDYEEVEIGQEDQEKYEVVVEEDAVHDEGEFNVEVEEDVNESSVVEESEEEIVIEADEGEHEEEEEEEEEVEDNDGNAEGDIYANVEMSGGMSITPSDTDKIIVTGGNIAAAAKTIRNNAASNKESGEDAVVIVAEDLTDLSQKEEDEKTEVETVVEAEVVVEQIEIEETPTQRLIKEGKVDTFEQAELALQLFEMNFSEDDSLSAAKECSSLCSALSWLQQECDLCTGKFSAREMVSMIHCTHLCCRNCAREYFTVQVRDKTIVDATCPFCAEPSVLTDDSELATDYFNHLDILLKNLLDSKHHEMFQRKLRDWTLAKTPNFKWCSKCSSGFITEPMQTRLVCPDCKAVTCAVCMETWDKVNHNHRDDAASSSMKLCDTTPKSIVEYLNANHIECPRCHFRFSLARGGCMHLTCTQCHHEFCSGCAAPFRMGDKCEAKYPICEKLGLHAHHPRNCLFYLRDKEPDVLAKLLEENAIPYFKENSGEEKTVTATLEVEAPTTETAEGDETTETSIDTNGKANTKTVTQRVCQVPIQKETSDGYMDDICGKEAPEGYATVCKTHYIEYLGLLIWQNHLDPITILTNDDLEVIVRRAFKKHPGRPNWLSDELFRKRLLKVINDEIPL